MTFGGLHLGPILLGLALVVDLSGVLYLAERIRGLEAAQRRIAGLMISHGWTLGVDVPEQAPGAHTLGSPR